MKGYLLVLRVEAEVGAQLSRPWGIGAAAKMARARVVARCGTATQLVATCGRSSLSSLYTLDTYVGAQSGRNGWMSVFSSLCIYSISQILAVVKNGKWKKMEGMENSGRRGIAGDGYTGRCAWEGMEGRLGGCHLRFSS